jgi:polysaccharide biosynthesis protein VpsM
MRQWLAGFITVHILLVAIPCSAKDSYTIQVASFRETDKALRLKEGLSSKYEDADILETTVNGTKFTRVRVGKFGNKKEAVKLVAQLEKEGHKPVIMPYRGDEKSAPANPGAGDDAYVKEVAVSVFSVREDAEMLADKLTGSGFEAVVRAYETDDGRTVYGVFVVVHEAVPEGPSKADSGVPPGEKSPEGKRATWKDVVTGRSGYVHAGLTVSAVYTDNALNTATNKKSDFSLILSPEIWLTLPGINQKPKGLDPISTRSPGGLLLSREGEEGMRRYNAFLLYGADVPLHSKNSPSGNTITHNVNGGLAYKFPFGLSIAVNDEFTRSYERLDSVLSGGEVDRYNGNLFYAIASLETGNRLRLRFDYSNFLLRYDARRNERLNRDDNSFSAYLFYRLWPKTSLFSQYAYTDIRYSDDPTLNSKEYSLFGGFQWDITAKTSGSVKAGLGIKDFESDETRNLIYEARVEHAFTPKSVVKLTAFGRTGETNLPDTLYTVDRGVRINYHLIVSQRVTGWVSFSYTNESYGQSLSLNGKTAKRNDDIYESSAGLEYWFKRWLRAGIAYSYITKESNFPDFEYRSNTVTVNVKGSL